MSAAPSLPPPSARAVLLESHLRRPRLPAMLAAYPKLVQEAAQAGLSYEHFLLALVEHEVAQRDEHMQRRRITAARFPALKTLDRYDFSLMPHLNKQLVLELAQGRYIAAKENALCVGEIGTGKPHAATALGIAACRQGYRVRFLTAAGLVTELVKAHAAHRLSRVEQALPRLHLLLLDEVGFVPFSKLGADLLFSALAATHERVSLILTTVPCSDWAQLFGGDQRLARALLDRLTFHAHRLHFTGDSFRLRQSLRQREADRRRR